MERDRLKDVLMRAGRSAAVGTQMAALLGAAPATAGAGPSINWDTGSGREPMRVVLEQVQTASVESPAPPLVSVTALSVDAASMQDTLIEGTGELRGEGPVPAGLNGEPSGAITVSGDIPVIGPGISGTAHVRGTIQIAASIRTPTKVFGCGLVEGVAELADSAGKPADNALVSGLICVKGSAQKFGVVPFYTWVATVQGVVKIKGTSR